jgi:hypothetical protein
MISRDNYKKTYSTWLEKYLVVKNSSLEEILTVILRLERVHESFGYGEQNQEGEEILNFVVTYDLMAVNTFFRKEKKSHLITFFQQ